METRQQRLIRRALEGDEKRGPTSPKASLQDKAVQHTDENYVPRTLTPYEWEEYYEKHGVPKSHAQDEASEAKATRRPVPRIFQWLLSPRD